MRKLWATLVILLLAATLAACSSARFGYVNGDSLVYWWINGYVSFDDDQKFVARKQLVELFAWHRQTQLKDYAQLMTGFQQRIQRAAWQPVTPSEIVDDYAAIRKRIKTTIERALPDLAGLALTLQPRQLQHLEHKFASSNDEYRDEFMRGALDARQSGRLKKVMKQAEYWFGDFSREQEAQILVVLRTTPLNNEIWLGERQRRQQEMLRMLRKIQTEKPDRHAALAMLKSYTSRGFEIFTYDEHPQFFDASREGVAKVVATIINVATPKQRAHAVKRLQQWIDDCDALAGK